MNQKIKQEWCEELISGRYTQGCGNLCRDDKYCCLGVLCEIAIKHGVKISKWRRYTGVNNSYCYNNEHHYLPKIVSDWAGLDSRDPELLFLSSPSLARMNDRGYSFNDIANAIEKYL
jgi:hypothetical protein